MEEGSQGSKRYWVTYRHFRVREPVLSLIVAAERFSFVRKERARVHDYVRRWRDLDDAVAFAKNPTNEPQHYRRNEKLSEDGKIMLPQSAWIPASRGGYTECYLYDPEGAFVAMGVAPCSDDDVFDYQEGRKEAFKDALQAGDFYQEDRPDLREARRELWGIFWNGKAPS